MTGSRDSQDVVAVGAVSSSDDRITFAEARRRGVVRLRGLRRFWWVFALIAAVTTTLFVRTWRGYAPSYVAGKQFVSVRASSNIFSGMGLSALGLGGIGSDPLSSGKGIVTVALSERILAGALRDTSGGQGTTLLDRVLEAFPAEGPLGRLNSARDTLPPELVVVAAAAILPKAEALDADFDIDTEFVTLSVETPEARLSEDLLAAWYRVLADFYRQQLYGQKANDVEVLQGKADSLRTRMASIERRQEAFRDNYQGLVRKTSELPLKQLSREALEAGTVYRTVLENLEVLRLSVETAGPVFAELNLSRAYASKVPRPSLRYLLVYVVGTGLLFGVAVYLLPDAGA